MIFSLNKLTNNNSTRLLTVVTCWYHIKSKFSPTKYVSWIQNLLFIVGNFNLIIYTDLKSFELISNLDGLNNPLIRIVFLNFEQFITYQFKDNWIKNHNESGLELHQHVDWKLNMLWNEKVFFVQDAYKRKYFNTPYYAWCDIGYFRNELNDTPLRFLKNQWPDYNKLTKEPFSIPYVHYGCIQNNNIQFVSLKSKITSFYKYKNNLGVNYSLGPNPDLTINCFAGGFFLIHRQLIDLYAKIYFNKLAYYFANNYIIKDDQTIITDIIFTNSNLFYIHYELTNKFNNWFMFQRLLI